MMLLFEQERITETYGKEREEKGRIEGAMENTVRMCQRFGTTIEEAINMLAQDFGLTTENASQYVKRIWEKS